PEIKQAILQYYIFMVPNVGKFCSELGIDLILNKLEQQKGKFLFFYYTKQTSGTLSTTGKVHIYLLIIFI
ncbi:MAG: hypothetical protein ACK559_25860, partial [bacterium]